MPRRTIPKIVATLVLVLVTGTALYFATSFGTSQVWATPLPFWRQRSVLRMLLFF
jgi:hypothetical protein